MAIPIQCDAPTDSADICLSQEQTHQQLLKLLPRGRAWRSDPDAPVRRGFWNAIAAVYAYIEVRICQLRLEFFCQTQSETNDVWLEQYGLPDACDPYPNLCAKVAAFGGTRCEYYVAIATLSGWSITCVDFIAGCGSRAGCGLAGKATSGGGVKATIIGIVVDVSASPAYAGGAHTKPLAGRLRAGQRLSCGPNIGPLDCILERVVHAHVLISYSIV